MDDLRRSYNTGRDVGNAVGAGAGWLYAAHKNSQMKTYVGYMEAAQKALEASEFEKALPPANSLIGTSNKEAQAIGHFFKASGFFGLDRHNEAITEYTAALDIARGMNQVEALSICYLLRGRSYYNKNDLAAALRDFTSYIQSDPNDASGYYWQSLALLKLGDLDESLANMNRAIAIDPGGFHNYRERADIYIRRNEVDKALQDLTRAITLNSQDAYSYQQRASLYAGRNDIALALADYSRAIELDPTNMQNIKARAELYRLSGDVDRSRADLSRVGREEPLQKAYQRYLQAATAAYDNGIIAAYTQADTLVKPNWGIATVQIVLIALAGLFSMTICASSVQGAGMPFIISAGSLVITLLLVWGIISSTRTEAPKKAKAATEYLGMLAQNEASMPGFAEFFQQYLQARKESRLNALEPRTRSFFESGPGSRVVQSISSTN